jgi:hypothetical protein
MVSAFCLILERSTQVSGIYNTLTLALLHEWPENKHGKKYIRRTWKKLHIALGNNGIITGATTTCHNKNDRSQVKELLKDVRTKEVLADPGYDGENLYQMLRVLILS